MPEKDNALETAYNKKSDPDGSGLLGAMMAHWIHEDQLIWNRTQTILVLQAAVLGGAYSLCTKSSEMLGIALLVCGAVVTSIILIIIEHNRRTRNINVKLMLKIGKRLSLPYSDAETPCFRLSAPAPYYRHLRGRTLLMFTIFVLVAVDVLGALWILLCWLVNATTICS